ncbi:MAG TPA: choline/ethanolamine kinase family protein [Kiloniellales bacterium]|jgi:thiamine kinase-like enzyme|nr:choline/ethanolamine kinase family protein [Kiloniellales bacterium]
MTQAEVLEALRQIPEFREVADPAEVQRLMGLTNRVYAVRLPERVVVLRIPGEGTEAYIDREVEAHNAVAAARAVVSPEVLYCDPKNGLMMTRHIEGTTMSPALFNATPGAPARAAQVLRKLHRSGENFRFRFELFAMIDDYRAVLSRLGASLPEGYDDVVAEAAAVREALEAHPVELAPCHCDPLCENFIDTGERMWLVDWEYSGMNDPLWDLGDLSVEAGFGPEQDREMMEAYCDGPVPEALYGRMVVYKAMCDLLWTLWGLIQHANKNPADDFWTYAVNRFERCKRLMAEPSFSEHLAAVRRG